MLLLTTASGAAAPPQPVRSFSDVTLEKTEGDYVGYTVILMQHRGGATIVFQEALAGVKGLLAVALTAFAMGKTVGFTYDNATPSCFISTLKVNP